MPFTDTFWTQPALISFAVLLLAILLEQVWQWPPAYHPLTLVRLLAQGMARKVHHKDNTNPMQQQIAGGLAMLVLLMPWAVILALFIYLAEYPYFFDGLLLLISLQYEQVRTQLKKIAAALEADKKQLARDTLQSWVLRDTQSLSSIGIGKAAIETLLLRFSYQHVTVVFWYLILGGVGAFCYRCLYEFAQSWNSKLPKYRIFGQPAQKTVAILSLPSIWITTFLFACAKGFKQTFKGLRHRPKRASNHNLILAAAGGAIGAELGGPAYYAGEKVRLAKVGGQDQVRLSHLHLAIGLVNQSKIVLLCLCCLVFALRLAASNLG